jgi:two-component sensor histidine kinase
MDAEIVSTAEMAISPTSLTLLEEISHRVLNEYSHAIMSLSMAAGETTNPEARLALTAVASRLHAYADVHRVLWPKGDSARVDLSQYLRRLCIALTSASLTDLGVDLTFIASCASMSAERCWRVGLILSELVTNAARHAFRDRGGRLVVEVHAREGMIYCRVADNGRPGSSPAGGGRGRKIVEDLARQLGGHVEWTFDTGGTTVLLSIPSDATAR